MHRRLGSKFIFANKIANQVTTLRSTVFKWPLNVTGGVAIDDLSLNRRQLPLSFCICWLRGPLNFNRDTEKC